MFVCICNAVKESQIKTAIEQGHDSLEALQAELDVATCCGGCQPMIEGYLEEYAQSINNYTHLFIEVAQCINGAQFIKLPNELLAYTPKLIH